MRIFTKIHFLRLLLGYQKHTTQHRKAHSSCASVSSVLNGVLRDAVHKLYDSVLYLENTSQFHGSCVHIISLSPIGKVQSSLRQFSWILTKIVDCIICRSLVHNFTQISWSMVRNSLPSLSKVWITLHQFLQNSWSLKLLCTSHVLNVFHVRQNMWKICSKFRLCTHNCSTSSCGNFLCWSLC
jgi:hypothetical protein